MASATAGRGPCSPIRRRTHASRANTPGHFTGADSKILNGPHGLMQGYNCQAAADSEAPIVLAHLMVNAQNA